MVKLSRREAAFEHAVKLLCTPPLNSSLTGIETQKLERRATSRVRNCIASYHEAKQRLANAPRVKGISAQLKTFEELASKLVALFEDRESLFVRQFELQADLGGFGDEIEAFIAGCTSPTNQPRGLRLALKLARLGREALAHAYGSGDPSKPDKGGRGSLYIDIYGTPRRDLLVSCAATYARYHSVDALTAASKGPFQNFALAVWEAAGEDEKKLSGRVLRNELREIVPAARDVIGQPFKGLGNAREVLARAFAEGFSGLDGPENGK